MGRKKKNKEEDIKVEFLGNSTVDVTQSCVQITFMGKKYLIECGMAQGYTLEKTYTLNSELIKSIKANDIEAIFLLHTHSDHIGLTPAIVKQDGFKGKVYTTYETKELSRRMLEDSAYIISKDVEYLSKKKKGKITPFYKQEDVITTYNKIHECELNKIYYINENVYFKLISNNHCLGASQLEIFFKTHSNKVKKITYTSDLGSKKLNHKPFVKPLEYSNTCNLFICESTYGKAERGYNKDEVVSEREDIKNTINEVVERNGSILLPCFSFSRTQEVLVELYKMFGDDENFNIPIVIDSKLSVDISAIYMKILKGKDLELMRNVSEWKNVKFNKDIKGTFANLADDKPKIVLSSQGFCEVGRSQLYAKHFLTNKNNAILIVGYCPPNSVGGRIMNPLTKTIKIGTDVFSKKCLVKSYKTFSSHAQQDDIIEYFKNVNTDCIILHHGTSDAKEELSIIANEELRKVGKTTPIIKSYRNMNITI